MCRILASVTARGFYDLSHRFIGTIGLIRNLSDRRKEQAAQQELLQQRQRAEELQTVIRQMSELSRALEQPLSTFLHESQQLANVLRESRLLDRMQALRGQAAASAELVQQLARLAPGSRRAHGSIAFSMRCCDRPPIERLQSRVRLGPSGLRR